MEHAEQLCGEELCGLVQWGGQWPRFINTLVTNCCTGNMKQWSSEQWFPGILINFDFFNVPISLSHRFFHFLDHNYLPIYWWKTLFSMHILLQSVSPLTYFSRWVYARALPQQSSRTLPENGSNRTRSYQWGTVHTSCYAVQCHVQQGQAGSPWTGLKDMCVDFFCLLSDSRAGVSHIDWQQLKSRIWNTTINNFVFPTPLTIEI